MSAPGTTPGPWSVYRDNEKSPTIAYVRSKPEFAAGEVAVLYSGAESNEANAHLIAAAPELYEALNDIRIHCLADIEVEECKDDPNEAALAIFRARRDKADAALSRARGEEVGNG